MKRLLLLPILLFATPALGAWESDSNTSKKSWFYAAYEHDRDGGVELQVYCDFKKPGDVMLLVFTGEDFDPRGEDAGDVEVSATVDGRRFGPLRGYNDSNGGERAVIVDSAEDVSVVDFVRAMRGAQRPVEISYKRTKLEFSTVGIDHAVGTLIDGCLSSEAPAKR